MINPKDRRLLGDTLLKHAVQTALLQRFVFDDHHPGIADDQILPYVVQSRIDLQQPALLEQIRRGVVRRHVRREDPHLGLRIGHQRAGGSAGIRDPRTEIDVAEVYVPFSWFEAMWMENLGFAPINEGWKMTADGVTSFEGDLPVNPSGGVLSSNPIGASGMLRFAEAAMQVRGQAGEHQVDGAKIALGHAYGGGSQFFAMWIVGSEKP